VKIELLKSRMGMIKSGKGLPYMWEGEGLLRWSWWTAWSHRVALFCVCFNSVILPELYKDILQYNCNIKKPERCQNVLLTFPLSCENFISECSQSSNVQFIIFQTLNEGYFWMFSELIVLLVNIQLWIDYKSCFVVKLPL